MEHEITERSPDESVVDIFVARQPIFQRDGNVWAYELLYRRNGRENWASGATANSMASDVIIHSFLNIGIERMTESKRAFVNFTREMLLDGVHLLFDKRQVAIELLETVEPDAAVEAACEALVRAGYTLVLDDFVYSPAFHKMLTMAHVIKVDVRDRTDADLATVVEQLKPYKVRLLAERVESREVRARCEVLGFDLFQGYFFSEPEIVSQRDLSADQLTIVRLMNLLRNTETSDSQVEDAFRGDLALTYKLLRSVNSAAVGGRGIESIQHAIRLTGRREMHKWLALLLLSSVVARGGADRELAITAVQRARLCELLAQVKARSESGSHFIVGLFSLLDAILRTPMKELLERIELSTDVRRALLNREGPFAPPLSLAEAYERGEWDTVSALAVTIGVVASEVPEFYLESLAWARRQSVGLD